MSPVVIVLIVIGLVFIFVSYGISSKLESSGDGENTILVPDELTGEQKEKISKLVNDYMDENVDGKLAEIEEKLSSIVNQKTLALGDYAVTVNEEIERNHNEVLFLYSMLSDKQKEIMSTAAMVDDYRKDVEAFVSEQHAAMAPTPAEQELEEAIREIDETINGDLQEDEEVEPVNNSKDIILEMHKSGLSILEIAKHLGLGVGEVKLVVDLYQGEDRA